MKDRTALKTLYVIASIATLGIFPIGMYFLGTTFKDFYTSADFKVEDSA